MQLKHLYRVPPRGSMNIGRASSAIFERMDSSGACGRDSCDRNLPGVKRCWLILRLAWAVIDTPLSSIARSTTLRMTSSIMPGISKVPSLAIAVSLERKTATH